MKNMIFWDDTKINSPIKNMAINKACVDMVKNDEYDLIARLYRHSKGVILGFAESIEDVNLEYCKKHGYEVTSRPSGGSAIIVDPALNLSYSVFFKKKSFNVHEIYQDLTIPLAKHLGDGFSVEGNYYLRYNIDGESIPIAGHAMKSYGGVTQFDGVVNLKRLCGEHIDDVLKTRELWRSGEDNYLKVEGRFFHMDGKEAMIDDADATCLRREKDELKKLVGLEDINISYEDFRLAFMQSLKDTFGDISEMPLDIDVKVLEEYSAQSDETTKNARKYLGHCFVDMVEEENPITRYRGNDN